MVPGENGVNKAEVDANKKTVKSNHEMSKCKRIVKGIHNAIKSKAN